MGCGASSGNQGKPESFEKLFGAQLQTKGGMKATSDVLGGKKAVLVYFSAHWCPPCRGFTPVLAKAYGVYDEGDIEVVFISADRDQASFDEYYGEMPWAAVPFEARDLKDKLSARFGVRGIPMLVVLKADGSLVTDNGRGAVQSTADLKRALASWGF